MARVLSPSLTHQLGKLFDSGSTAGITDGQLLERFASSRDDRGEAAFAALVARHGPMVLNVCRQLLGDHHDAEDAFQAVFLVLARKARSLREPELLGNWLYGVALRTARKARGRRARRWRTELEQFARHPAMHDSVPTDRKVLDAEQAMALHGEIDRLPGSFRMPVVLCYFEGLSIDEAAHRLKWPIGTLRSRLARARDKLRRGLVRRGYALSATALAAALASGSASASVSPLLCDNTARAATVFAAGYAASISCSGRAVTLARQVLRTALFNNLRLAMMTVLACAAIAAGAGLVMRSAAMNDDARKKQVAAAATARVGSGPASRAQTAGRKFPEEETTKTKPRPTDGPPQTAGRMIVTGRVLDPQGKPVANATTLVYASLKWPGRGDRLAPSWPSAIGQAESDGSGRFRLDAPRASSARHDVFGIVASAPGYGAAWATLDPDAAEPAAVITLRPEQVILGRLFDVQGRPAQGVRVSVETMGTSASGSLGSTTQYEGPYFLPGQHEILPGWPRPATSDGNGQFTIHGVGCGVRFSFWIDDPRFARLSVDLDTDAFSKTKNVAIAVEPARIITGRVTYADSGAPAPHAQVEVETQTDGSSAWSGDFETDADGRFRARPGAAPRYSVNVFAPDRSPYLNVTKNLEWPKGTLEQTVDLSLPRGVLVRGKVVGQESGKPIPGARVSYISSPNRDQRAGSSNGRAVTALDGSFQLGVLAAPGYLTVLGPGEDFVLREIGRSTALANQPGGGRFYSHAFHRLDLKPGSASQDVVVALRPSASVVCRVVSRDGQPVNDAVVISRVILQPTWIAWLIWRASHCGAVHHGQFLVHGLPPDSEVPVYFLDAKRNRGTTALLSGKMDARGPVTVRLEPCGAARARLVDSSGKPVPGLRDGYGSHMTELVVTPGPHILSQDEHDQRQLAADLAPVAQLDPVHYGRALISDGQGELTMPALIPGATYRIYDTSMGQEAGPRLRKEFTVKSGEKLDLGDILIEGAAK
jgi:RNA polymerase sigma factor (sigma-70 family)